MKNKTLTLLTLLFCSTSAFAQVTNGDGDLTDGSSKPASILSLKDIKIGKTAKWILRRLNTLDLNSLATQQQATGKWSQTYYVNASGALFYDYNLNDMDKKAYASTGINVGSQILPFTVSVANNDQYYVSVDVLTWRNMNALQHSKVYGDPSNTACPTGMDCTTPDGFFQVIDNFDLVIFKMDRNFSFSNLNSMGMDFAQFDGKLDILGSKIETRYLAIVFGGGFGYQKGDLNLGSSIVHLGSNGFNNNQPENKSYSPEANTVYGLKYNTESKKGLRLTVQTLMRKRWEGGSYTTTLDQNAGKYSRTSIYFNPSIELSKRVSAARSNSPVRLGLGVTGNIPTKDLINTNDGSLGKNQIDLTPFNNQLVKARLFVNF